MHTFQMAVIIRFLKKLRVSAAIRFCLRSSKMSEGKGQFVLRTAF